MQEIKVKNVICSFVGQEKSENYEEFVEIINTKKINVLEVFAGKRVNIEKDLYINILWPLQESKIYNNEINNNSMVFKLCYKNFSMLFTGDIEEEAEKKICNLYNSENVLKSTILKVAHHGSKTSSTEEFLNLVSPKLALIGVGKNNNFGHPSNMVIDRLKNIRC